MTDKERIEELERDLKLSIETGFWIGQDEMFDLIQETREAIKRIQDASFDGCKSGCLCCGESNAVASELQTKISDVFGKGHSKQAHAPS